MQFGAELGRQAQLCFYSRHMHRKAILAQKEALASVGQHKQRAFGVPSSFKEAPARLNELLK